MPKILIIEDHNDIRENLEELLDIAGYEVIAAEDGAVGIEKCYSEMPDFIICDIAMPIKDGYEVFATLRAHLKNHKTPFIFLSASAQERDIAKGKTTGVDAYLTKPFQIDHLLQVISNLLNKVV